MIPTRGCVCFSSRDQHSQIGGSAAEERAGIVRNVIPDYWWGDLWLQSADFVRQRLLVITAMANRILQVRRSALAWHQHAINDFIFFWSWISRPSETLAGGWPKRSHV